jgi:hypothetical protein
MCPIITSTALENSVRSAPSTRSAIQHPARAET